MSILAAAESMSPAALAKQVLSLSSFADISPDNFKLLLRYLVEINHIQKTETGKLILGLEGEKIVSKFKFYAVFPETEEYLVKQGTTEIGSIIMPPPVGNQFALAGRNWEVVELDFRKKIISVKQVEGNASIFWRGGSGNIHSRILQRMKQILIEDIEYPYLQKNAIQRLQSTRRIARDYELEHKYIVPISKDKCCILPWMGTVAFRTLERLINSFCREPLEIKSIRSVNPYYLLIKLNKNKLHDIYPEIISLCEQRITADDLLSDVEAPEIQKYDKFIPTPLLRKAFTCDYLDLGELRQIISNW